MANHFYEKDSYDSSGSESGSESESEIELDKSQTGDAHSDASETMSEESSDEMPLPMFLLDKHSVDYSPIEINKKEKKKEDHSTRKGLLFKLFRINF